MNIAVCTLAGRRGPGGRTGFIDTSNHSNIRTVQACCTLLLYDCAARLYSMNAMPTEPAEKSHRDKILRGALICLREKGYARTTARDIAEAAGANLGSIGYHFGGKDALLAEALAH